VSARVGVQRECLKGNARGPGNRRGTAEAAVGNDEQPKRGEERREQQTTGERTGAENKQGETNERG
jgi:hypothetical protein